MDTPKKLIVGYDLCEDMTQISCYSYKSLEPIPISTREGEECPIPTVLCVKTETKQWLFGDEAIACAAGGAGVLVEHLLEKVRTGEEVEILGQTFTGVALLEKFLRKSLTLVKNHFPTEPITKIVVTIRNAEPSFVDRIYEALSLLGLEKDRAVIMNHAGAYLYYTLSQDRSIWMNDVGLFDLSSEGLYYYQTQINRRNKPMIAGLKRIDYSDNLNIAMLKQQGSNSSYIFENIANTALYKQIVSTLYFTGNGFEGGWADEVIKSLCVGRRVFYGQNLFTKGACYAAKEFSGDQKLSDFVLLNDDMISGCVSVRVYSDTRIIEVPLTQAGETWYEVNNSIEIIPEGESELELSIKNIMTKEVIRQSINLNQFPVRQDRTMRLLINFTCKDKSTGYLTVTDLGFGDFYPGTGKVMAYTIEI